MSWVTVIWSMTAATCLTLAGVHLLVWLRARDSWMNLWFTVGAVAVAAHAGFELALMRATSPEHYGTVLRWMHVPVWVILVSFVWFVRLYFGAGRSWLIWTTCGLRTLALGLNFWFTPNLNYRAITGLRPFPLWGESVSLPIAVTNHWTLVGQLSSLLFLVYVVDASIIVWRRGERRKAVVMGGTLALSILVATGQSALLVWGVVPLPYILSLVFLAIVLVMGHELSRDVLRAAQVSRELRASEQRMSLAATAADLGMWEWDIAGQTFWVSTKSRERLGLGESEPMDLNRFLQKLHPDDRETVHRTLDQAMKGNGDYQSEYRIVLPGGEVRWIAAAGHMNFDAAHSPVHVRGVSMDITRRKQAELQVQQQRDELAHISRVAMLGELSGSLAHELNQPLTAILSNAQAAQRFLARDPSNVEQVQEILTDIVADNRRAGEVIQRLRRLFQKGEVERQPLDLNELVREVVRLVQSEVMSKGMELRTELAPDLPPVVGDRVQLQQVLLNLVANASHAMMGAAPADRQLVVRTGYSAGEGLRVSVTDRGCGIPAGDLTRIFEAFYTTRPEGMGFGLAVSRTIIAAHQWKIWAENNADRGASFHFTLPAAPGGKT